MVKFRYIIHKETGTVIKYEDWKRCINNNLTISIYRGFKDNIKFAENDAKEALSSDDFEIIYDSEFTYRELRNIFLSMNDKEICHKAEALMKIKEKYDSETVEKELDEVFKKRREIESGVKNE